MGVTLNQHTRRKVHIFKMVLKFNIAICLVLLSFSFKGTQVEANFFSLNPCELAIWSCCQSDRQLVFFPQFCFDRHGCPGYYLFARNPCNPKVVKAVGKKIMPIQNQISSNRLNSLK